MKSKESYKNETRILCEKIKYIGDLIGDFMNDTEGEIQNKYLQSEIEKHRLDLLNPIGLLPIDDRFPPSIYGETSTHPSTQEWLIWTISTGCWNSTTLPPGASWIGMPEQ